MFGRRQTQGLSADLPKKQTPGFGRGLSARAESAPPQAEAAPAASLQQSAPLPPTGAIVDHVFELIEPIVKQKYANPADRQKTTGDLSVEIDGIIREQTLLLNITLNELERRDLVTILLNEILTADVKSSSSGKGKGQKQASSKETIEAAKNRLQPLLLEHIDSQAAAELERGELAEQISEVISELMVQEKINLNLKEQRELVTMLLNDMLGLGPLEPLLQDEKITDILVNGPDQIYIETGGRLQLTDIKFRDQAHLMNICTRIVSAIGRRVDESSPLCDARLKDGSRVNIIIPPLAIDGSSISIRKFSKKKITLDRMVDTLNLSPQMCTVLKIAGACRLNIVISGGTGSGKTTMLNALSRLIDPGERVVTIEDAAELQLQQPHVVRLETRPANLEGNGEITMRDLLKNALRMRPDRIILGEVRGGEALDVLQAMNTGHDGSMCTLHANRPREALVRLENMVSMGSVNLPQKAIRTQIAAAVDLIVQVSRMRDGVRRVQAISEVVGMEGDVITTQDLFTYEFEGEDDNGTLIGSFRSTGVRPHFAIKAEYYGLHRALLEAM
ncbi:CpaF family protein [Govanella unica]|uniref:CpaF family protein n=1 Tax=Govanella unica TaxID=2975056 RepID=A0A9X3U0E9_9PROT|nr:CpaF family protein [Govania unica]